ncbi:MAG: molybdopterin-binding protein, partial [Clostridia bacterium]|nr:molybdopterin-binding protein [Clostridia bacterium]
ISTGDELIPAEAAPGPGQVRDVNSVLLAADIERFGGEARLFGIVRDGYERLREEISSALGGCDILLISGG